MRPFKIIAGKRKALVEIQERRIRGERGYEGSEVFVGIYLI
jgi:hypothetical protein